ncbi:MAG TPA: hypothetical protein VMT53_12375 [Terriglobales bacterium]|nr:hypothetical protein [Terriglobales bacterium]
MLRITAITSDKVVVKLEGRLVGPWVRELKKTILRTNGRCQPLEIDVSDLTFADEKGERALRWLHRMGAHFQGKEPFAEYLFQRLKIPLFAACGGLNQGDELVVGRRSVQRNAPVVGKSARTRMEEH